MSESLGFILGFIAGEGSFQVDITKRPSRARYNVTVRPRVSILVHEGEILDELQKVLGGKRYTKEPQHRLDIRSIDESKKLIQLIESADSGLFKMTDKYEQYLGWKRVVELKDNNITKEEIKEAVEIGYSIGMPDKRKYDKEYFLKAIENSGNYLCEAETKNGGKCQRRVATPDGNCQWHK